MKKYDGSRCEDGIPAGTAKKVLFSHRFVTGGVSFVKLVGVTALVLFFSTACLEPTGPITVGVSNFDEGLTVTALPALTEYQQGFPFEAKGIEVMLNDSGWFRNVTPGVKFSWYGGDLHNDGTDTAVTSQTGAREITVSYDYAGRSFETSFRIDVSAGHFLVGDTASWVAAMNNIDTQTRDRSFVITLRGDFKIPPLNSPSISRTDGIDVTLRTLRGEKAVLRLEQSITARGPGLYIGEMQTFIIDGGGLTMTGGTSNNKPLIAVDGSGARLELRNGTIKGNKNSGNGGGVSLSGAGTRMIMSGGEISGNIAEWGGGVYIDGGDFDMTGGSITGNQSTGINTTNDPLKAVRNGGGGVNVIRGTFTMSGRSRISGNHAELYGGGVYGRQGSTITIMDESTITGNTAVNYGGGVGIGDRSSAGGGAWLIIKGGVISGNEGGYGGGVYTQEFGNFRMADGIIYGSDAAAGLANTLIDENSGLGAAFRGLFARDVREWGFFDQNGTWQSNGVLAQEEDGTIKVVNGERK